MLFTDGSYMDMTPPKFYAGWGYYSLGKKDGKIIEKTDHSYVKSYDHIKNLRQVNGEVSAANKALALASSLDFSKADIYCDLFELPIWDCGIYKPNSSVAKRLMKFMEKYRFKMNIIFHWCRSHKGIEYNERADAEAKLGFKKAPKEA